MRSADGLDGWSFLMRTADRDFALAYFENRALRATLKGFSPNARIAGPGSIRAPASGSKPLELKADAAGALRAPPFPDGRQNARRATSPRRFSQGSLEPELRVAVVHVVGPVGRARACTARRALTSALPMLRAQQLAIEHGGERGRGSILDRPVRTDVVREPARSSVSARLRFVAHARVALRARAVRGAAPQARGFAGIEDDQRRQSAERGQMRAGELAVGEHEAALTGPLRIEERVARVVNDVVPAGFEFRGDPRECRRFADDLGEAHALRARRECARCVRARFPRRADRRWDWR